MATFLSDDWFHDLESAINSVVVGEENDKGLALGQIINDTPEGSICYTLIVGGGREGQLVQGSIERADVALVEDFASAEAIVGGAPVAELLAQGKIKIRGDLNALLCSGTELQAIAQALEKVTRN